MYESFPQTFSGLMVFFHGFWMQSADPASVRLYSHDLTSGYSFPFLFLSVVLSLSHRTLFLLQWLNFTLVHRDWRCLPNRVPAIKEKKRGWERARAGKASDSVENLRHWGKSKREKAERRLVAERAAEHPGLFSSLTGCIFFVGVNWSVYFPRKLRQDSTLFSKRLHLVCLRSSLAPRSVLWLSEVRQVSGAMRRFSCFSLCKMWIL